MTESDERSAEDMAESAPALLERAIGIEWYERPGSDIDRAAYALCSLRREGGPIAGDEAVRRALSEASSPALVWFVSRAISFMDESGFPEQVELWFEGEGE